MSKVQERQQNIVAEYAKFPTWEERYKQLIKTGKELGDLPDTMKTEDAKVRGCQSQVWLHAKLNEKGEILFQADSDAMIVKGLVALLLKVYSEAAPDEILASKTDFLKELAVFDTNLSPSRTNGLFAMVKQMLYYATAFKTLLALRS